jgi:recombination protein RecA
MGRGYPLGRITNIVGDKSTGKTLLAIEACVNFSRTYPGKIRYVEAEAAFDVAYAETLGLPADRVEMSESIRTVEDLFTNLQAFLTGLNKDEPALYIVDSLDALSDEAEFKREIGDGSYGANKAKKLSEMFRRLERDLADKKCAIISQVRDNIGVTFGEKLTRSGGRALDFYASIVIWLKEVSKIKKTVAGIERPIGIEVQVRCKKNKVAMPYREATIISLFGYGVDDAVSCLLWLKMTKTSFEEYGGPEAAIKLLQKARKAHDTSLVELESAIKVAVQLRWSEIEEGFAPGMVKYE